MRAGELRRAVPITAFGIWDVDGKEPAQLFDYGDDALSVDFSPSGNLIAVGGGEYPGPWERHPTNNFPVKIWDIEHRRLIRELVIPTRE